MKLHEIEQPRAPWQIDVNGDVNATNYNLTSFRGAPRVVPRHFVCIENKIASLDGIPEEIGGDCMIDQNRIKNLHNIHKHIKRIGGHFYAAANGIESHVLGLCLIKGITAVSLFHESIVTPIDKILNRHLGGDILVCQHELIEAGYANYAKL